MRRLKFPISNFQFLTILVLCVFAFIPLYLYTFILVPKAHAQSLSGATGGIDLTQSAMNPNPGQTLTVSAQSYSANIDSADLTWTAGGQTIAKGIGVTSVTVQAPALGKHLTINVTAATPDGQMMSSSITLGSGSVDMIIEPDGYTPPFFMGKIPPAYQNNVKITAMPHLANSSGIEYNPQTLVYQWEENDSVMQDQSGYGKQSVVIPGNIVPRPYNVKVTVSTRDGSAQGTGLASVTPGSPSVAFYDNDPLYGPLYNEALGSTAFVGAQRELGILAVPYGFNIIDPSSSGLSWSWLINNSDHPELDNNESVTLRAPAGAGGSSDIETDVTNGQQILQQGSANLSVVFSSDSTANAASSVTF